MKQWLLISIFGVLHHYQIMNSMYLMMYPLENTSIPCQLKLSFYNISKNTLTCLHSLLHYY